MNAKIETFFSTVLTLCAVVVSVAVVRAQFWPAGSARREPAGPVFEKQWETLLPDARWIGPKNAALRIVVFSDYECPFCRDFHERAEAVMREFDGRVSLAFLHFPLAMHRFADGAAKAADCAAEQERFREMTEQLFEHQDSIGLITWRTYAERAGVANIASFDRCTTRPVSTGRLDSLRARGAAFSVQGTPTVLVNGWRLPLPPSADSLRRYARDAAAGRALFQ